MPPAGTQWHPEKPPFEFEMAEVPHSMDSILVSQHLANMFIDTARRSSHVAESHEEELALLIYDTPVTFSARFEVREQESVCACVVCVLRVLWWWRGGVARAATGFLLEWRASAAGMQPSGHHATPSHMPACLPPPLPRTDHGRL